MGRLPQPARVAHVLLATGAALVLMVCSCCFCSGFVAVLGNGSRSVQTTISTGAGNGQHGAHSSQTGVAGITQKATATATTQPTATPEPTAIATAIATATPTPRPTATATPTPRPQPTATPKPSCIPGSVNCNP